MAIYDATKWEVSNTPRCYETHPILKIGKGTLVGGSASWPKEKKADIYVALQSGSTSGLSSDPWEKHQVVEIHFSIDDQHAPKNVERFKKMITYLCNQLHDGKTVHVGCVGGHGRTGIVIAAIVAQMMEEKDAIQWVRKHYCTKAVESTEQVQFLMKHYGVSKVDVRDRYIPSSTSTGTVGKSGSLPFTRVTKTNEPRRKESPEMVGSVRTFVPMASKRCIWRGKE